MYGRIWMGIFTAVVTSIVAAVSFIVPASAIQHIFSLYTWQATVQTFSCNGDTTTLHIGSTAQTLSSYFNGPEMTGLHASPAIKSAVSEYFGAAVGLIITDGPVCSEGMIWVKAKKLWGGTHEGWIFDVRETSADPNNLTLKYDPLLTAPTGDYLEVIPPRIVYSGPNTGTPIGVVWRGTAFKVVGTIQNEAMFHIQSGTVDGWICGGLYYYRHNLWDIPLPIEGPAFTCSEEDTLYTTSHMVEMAGGQVYKKGEYPDEDGLTSAVKGTVIGKMLEADDTLLYVKRVYVTGAAIDMVCVTFDPWKTDGFNSMESMGSFSPLGTNEALVCTLYDPVIHRTLTPIITGESFVFADIYAHAEAHIERWYSDIQNWAKKMSLTPGECLLNMNDSAPCTW